MELHKLNNLEKVLVVSRPSKICKTPYVADIQLHDGTIVQAHSASLGCCGLCEKGCYVYASPMKSNCPQTKSKICSYKIYLAEVNESKTIENINFTNHQLIGIEPKLAELLTERTLINNYLPTLKNIKTYKREVKFDNSRFDFFGIDKNNKHFILEVKNVPLCHYADVCDKEKKTLEKQGAFNNIKFNDKISYFPDGYRKKKGDVVSERALKHINELKYQLIQKTVHRSIICFVVQRTDCGSFQASNLDPTYQKAFYDAIREGVEVIVLVVKWDLSGNASYWNTINTNIL